VKDYILVQSQSQVGLSVMIIQVARGDFRNHTFK